MPSFSLDFPADFDDHAWEVESKGWFAEARLTVSGKRYRLNFYDPVRLEQEIRSALESGAVFFEPNLVTVPAVTRAHMVRAAELLVQSRQVASLAQE